MSRRDLDTDALREHFFDLKPRKGDLRKLAIVEEAIRCLAHRGIEETSLEMIGKRLKISRSHIIYYFKDKRELLDAVIHLVTATGQAIFVRKLRGESEPLRLIMTYVNATFDWIAAHREHAQVMTLFQYRCTHDARDRALHTQIRATAYRRIETIIAPIVDRNPDLRGSAADLAKVIHCYIVGYYTEFLTTDPSGSLEHWRRRAQKHVKQVLRLV